MSNEKPDGSSPGELNQTRIISKEESDHTKLIPEEEKPSPPSRIDEYQVIKSLGEGGMGTVYLAHDPDLDRQVAIKMVRPELLGSEEYLTRMLREAKLCARLNHPNIVQIYRVGRVGKSPFLVMEYVEGHSLQQRLRTPPPLEVANAIEVICQCCVGLGEAAKKKIVHRDIKPANIMINKNGLAKIMDFGLSKSLSGDSMTMTSAIMGTPDYMAPEQAQGSDVDFRVDIYALGITLFQCCTGYLPYRSTSAMETLMNHRTKPLPDDPKLKSIAKGRLWDLIAWMTNKDPADRPNSYDDLYSHLYHLLDVVGSHEKVTMLPSYEYGERTPSTINPGTPPSQKNTPKPRPTSKRKAQKSSGKSYTPWLLVAALLAAGGVTAYVAMQSKEKQSQMTPHPEEAPVQESPIQSTEPLITARSPTGGGDLGGLIFSLQSQGLNLVIDSSIQPKVYPAAFHFQDANPRAVFDLICLGANWKTESEDGIDHLTYGGAPSGGMIRESRTALGEVHYPKATLSNLSGQASLQEVLEGFRRSAGINYLMMPTSLARQKVPRLGLTDQPINTILELIRRQGENTPDFQDFEWIYQDNNLLIIPAKLPGN